jgi:hypothetical protein
MLDALVRIDPWGKNKMTKQQHRSGNRFRLLLYERMWKRWAMPCILIVPASVVLWLFTGRLFSSSDALLHRALGLLPHSLISSISFLIELSAPILSILHVLYDFLALVPALIALALLVLIFLSRRAAWVPGQPPAHPIPHLPAGHLLRADQRDTHPLLLPGL